MYTEIIFLYLRYKNFGERKKIFYMGNFVLLAFLIFQPNFFARTANILTRSPSFEHEKIKNNVRKKHLEKLNTYERKCCKCF